METTKTSNTDFKLLVTRNMIDILDSDTNFGTFTFDNGKYFIIAIPYLSDPMLCSISTEFGLVARYDFDTTNHKKQNKSRLQQAFSDEDKKLLEQRAAIIDRQIDR